MIQAYIEGLGGVAEEKEIVHNYSELELFFMGTYITDEAQITAVTNLHDALKESGIWDKMIAVYPCIGGTIHTHRWNLRNPTKHNIGMSTGSHSALGFTPNNSMQFMNIHPDDIDITDFHASFYANNNSTINSGGYDLSEQTSAGNLYMGCLNEGGFMRFRTGYQSDITYFLSDCRGLSSFNRKDDVMGMYRRAVLVASATRPETSPPTRPLVMNYGSIAYNRRFSFICIGKGLTDEEITSLNDIVQAYQTELGRAV